jgi:hypothetical protein
MAKFIFATKAFSYLNNIRLSIRLGNKHSTDYENSKIFIINNYL